MPGARAHGSVTGVQEYGVFVAFCGGVRGLAPVSELGLQPGQAPGKHFAVGKVGRCSWPASPCPATLLPYPAPLVARLYPHPRLRIAGTA